MGSSLALHCIAALAAVASTHVPTPLRVEFPGALYHVTSRGDRRESIYLDEADRQQWLTLFGQVCQHFNWICHAYCLMDNHFHIVVETIEGNLSAGMRQLNGVYA